MPEDVDLLVVGAGPTGCVIAERAATLLGWRCLVIDKRPHIAGNCYDHIHTSGLRVHDYGPHYFRTSSPSLVQYLSRFSSFHAADYIVRSCVGGRLYPFPINLTTLERFFGCGTLTPESAESLLAAERENFQTPSNSEEYVLSRVGRRIYEAFYLGYTLKQWGRHPRELSPGVCGRIPIRFSRDERYVDHRFQIMPTSGYTAMFSAMLAQPNIRVRLNTRYSDIRNVVRPKRATVYCGPVDEYFDFRLGRLPWRSLEFDFRLMDKEWAQSCVQINYPSKHDYTRSVEIKHVTRQAHAQSILAYEYPRSAGDPYYPVPTPESQMLHSRYQRLAEAEQRLRRVYFCGRLAEYRYLNSDQAIERSLSLFETLRTECSEPTSDAHFELGRIKES